jgi:hypothetical protein
VHEHISGLDVFVNQASLVHLTERIREPDGEVQELRYRQRSIEVARQRDRPRRP